MDAAGRRPRHGTADPFPPSTVACSLGKERVQQPEGCAILGRASVPCMSGQGSPSAEKNTKRINTGP